MNVAPTLKQVFFDSWFSGYVRVFDDDDGGESFRSLSIPACLFRVT